MPPDAPKRAPMGRLGRYLSRHLEDDALPLGWPACVVVAVGLIVLAFAITEEVGWIDLI